MNRKFYMAIFLCLTTGLLAGNYVVTSVDDQGSGTLRSAIQSSVDGDTITFDPSLTGTIFLQSSLPPIVANHLTITGNSESSITIDGASSYQIFKASNVTLTIANINLSHGASAEKGGAIYADQGSNVYLKNSSVIPSSGQACINSLYAGPNGVLYLEDVVLPDGGTDSQVYLDQGCVQITSNTPQYFVIDGVGSANVLKYGPALTSICPPSSANPSDYYMNALEGVTQLDGSIDEAIVVGTSGSLQGVFSASYISNSGLVMPGTNTQFGVITLPQGYISQGTTQIKINPAGASDLIQTSSTAVLTKGTLAIVPAEGTYLVGTIYTFLTASNGITGTFSTVATGGLHARVNYNYTSIEVEILGDTTL